MLLKKRTLKFPYIHYSPLFIVSSSLLHVISRRRYDKVSLPIGLLTPLKKFRGKAARTSLASPSLDRSLTRGNCGRGTPPPSPPREEESGFFIRSNWYNYDEIEERKYRGPKSGGSAVKGRYRERDIGRGGEKVNSGFLAGRLARISVGFQAGG